MKDKDAQELLPCPFCGDENPCEQWTGDHVRIECMNCHAFLPYGGATFRKGYCETEEEAISVAIRNWNTRATETEAVDEQAVDEFCTRKNRDRYCAQVIKEFLSEQGLLCTKPDYHMTQQEQKIAKKALLSSVEVKPSCDTCKDDPAQCADLPNIRHCEKYQRERDREYFIREQDFDPSVVTQGIADSAFQDIYTEQQDTIRAVLKGFDWKAKDGAFTDYELKIIRKSLEAQLDD